MGFYFKELYLIAKSKIHTFILIILLFIFMATSACAEAPSIGSIIIFGECEWHVLDVKDGNALIISEQILERRPYHSSFDSLTWENCNLREYLNNEYYNKFIVEERSRIIETNNSNPPNPWYDTDGGADTIDKIFLLSLDEVVKYFGDSEDLRNKKRLLLDFEKSTVNDIVTFESPDGYFLSDQYNEQRVAKEIDDNEWYWWLRSSGLNPYYAVYVNDDGVLYINGLDVINLGGGVRPAMWVRF